MSKLVLLALTATVMMAQDPADQATKPPKAAESPDVAAGKTQFAQTCGFCHGANARGASGPDLIHSSLVSHDVKGDLIGPVVLNGRPDKGMPAFQLSQAQIQSIAAYLHSEAHLASTVYARGPGEYPLAKLLVGNPAAGKQYFETKCTSCHSPAGDLAHVATRYKPVDLQSRIAFPSGAVPALTVTEPSGNVLSGTQVYADEFVVSLRDKNNWIHTYNRKLVQIDSKDPLETHIKLLAAYTDKNLHDLFAYLETLK